MNTSDAGQKKTDSKDMALRAMVGEASQALALLDAAALHELALACESLNRAFEMADPAAQEALARQARLALPDAALFARVLAATRDNLNVMHRLRERRAGLLEYSNSIAVIGPGSAEIGSSDGND